MQDNHARRLQMFVRVNNFGADHSADFVAGGLGRQLFVNMGGIVDILEDHASAESSAFGTAREGTATRAAARQALRDDLEAISRTARALGENTPGLDDKFRLPRGDNDQTLLNAARAFATDAAPLSSQFISHELPSDFLTGLNSDIADMEAAINHQSGGVGDHVSAGAAIDESIADGMKLVRMLDAIVRNRYANNPATLAEWTSASHTERSPRHSPPTAPPPGAGAGSSPPPAWQSARIFGVRRPVAALVRGAPPRETRSQQVATHKKR